MDLGETIAALMPEHPSRAIVDPRCAGRRAGPRGARLRAVLDAVRPAAPDLLRADRDHRHRCQSRGPARRGAAAVRARPAGDAVVPQRRAWLGMPGFAQVTRHGRKVIVDSASLGTARAALPLPRPRRSAACSRRPGLDAAHALARDALPGVRESRVPRRACRELSRVAGLLWRRRRAAGRVLHGRLAAWIPCAAAGVHAARAPRSATRTPPAGEHQQRAPGGPVRAALHVIADGQGEALTVR